MKSILSKLNLLVIISVLLVGIVSMSLWSIREDQQIHDQQLATILQIQQGIDTLRSQLWIFLQYKDKASLEEVYMAQQSLTEQLGEQTNFKHYIENLEKMNYSLAVLLRQERALDDSKLQSFPHSVVTADMSESRSLLHSRYNMIAQSMGEELFHLQQEVHVGNRAQQEKALAMTALVLLFFTLLVSFTAILIFKQFKAGQDVIKEGIHNLYNGDLDTLISIPKLAEEYVVLVTFFNKMKVSLQNHIVTKDELEREVKLKTSTLMHQTDQLRYLSERDSLTGVLNRRAFYHQLDVEAQKALSSGTLFALLFIDLDKFKAINDNKGHNVGDEVLATFSSRLKDNMRPTDVIGRVGGDEFVVCINGLSDEANIESKLDYILDVLDKPMEIKDESIQVSCSIGVSYYPTQSDNVKEVLELADQAMYEAKKKSGSRYFSLFKKMQSQVTEAKSDCQ
ncbi:diguanylate cyclase [Vibrio sp. 10N.261.55.A7]|uniref:GGDEF domain-containing protein n=1 Tax=Vibrio sp. 10N.261.55.A7 TaxID=1880851 RepID=UPI001F534EFE|nr:diguanylate cyclase [Vibrio sp. 10N.261.55.A7]